MMFALRSFDYSGRVGSFEEFAAFDIETVQAIIETSGDVLTNELLPLNKAGDEQGVTWDPETGDVTTPEGFPEAYQMLVDNGMMGITGPAEYGGGGGPESLGVILGEIGTATNKSFSMCPGLTRGLVDALTSHASDEQKDFYLPKLVSGEWSGTMCLTEPHCGTDLGLIRTKAVSDGDHYKLSGTKIWITFGEHDLTDNIIHFVLARLPDAPEGTKGISVFLVPKYIDGERNAIRCTGLEHKMGIHASPTCEIQMEDAVGYLVGEPHKGMRAMFTMMNIARLHVGLEGIALGDIAYQTALAFAKDRRQSRALNPERSDPDAPADNIMVHPDVRRMLLNVKSTTELMRALAVWVAIEHDVSLHHDDEDARQEADDLVSLLTPVVKAFCTDRGFRNISEAMQVCGGAGYTTDWDIEQYMRDERIALLYEGTNHIQALDLVGRKLPRHGGRLMQVFSSRVTEVIRENKDNEAMSEFIEPLKTASKQLTAVTMDLATKAMEDREIAGAVASNYLELFGLVALAFVGCRQAAYALANPGTHTDAKLKTIRYYMQCVLPETTSLVEKINAGKANLFEFDVEDF
jgi:alkylation response protein AidB-like acyl-CoA dehydrogenase